METRTSSSATGEYNEMKGMKITSLSLVIFIFGFLSTIYSERRFLITAVFLVPLWTGSNGILGEYI